MAERSHRGYGFNVQIEVFHQNGWFTMENPAAVGDIGVPPFQETLFICVYICIYIYT